ncbi:MAG: EAL domain-containing protein [Actinomycetota bacterium]
MHESRRSLTQRLQDIRLAGELRDALHRHQLSTVFQPIVDLTEGTIVGVEALCRWRHPQRGDIRPDEFIPAAERTGLVHHIGHLVLSDTLAQLRRWDDTGRVVASAAVNVSATELADPALVDRVRDALHAWGIAPKRLVIEVTETAVISDFATASRQLAALQALGIRVAIDDFGTGQSSLAYLRRFDLDIVKIDREFVRDILACPKAERMVQAIIRLAAAMGAETVAEGIESSAEANRLRRLGCQVGQGYHLGRPMPARELDALLSTHTAVRPGRSAPLHTTRPDVDSAVRAAFHRT